MNKNISKNIIHVRFERSRSRRIKLYARKGNAAVRMITRVFGNILTLLLHMLCSSFAPKAEATTASILRAI